MAVLLLVTMCSRGQLTLKQTLFEVDAMGRDTLEIPIGLDDSHPFERLDIPDSAPLMRLAENKSCACFNDAIHIRKHPGVLPLIEVIVEPYFLNTAGTYELTFYYTFKPGGANTTGTGPMQAAVITLVRPAAVLDTVPVVRLEIEGGEVKSADALVLHEIGGKASVPALKLDAPVFKGVNEGNVIKFDSASCYLDAAAFVRIKYRPQPAGIHELPLGRTQGQLFLNAPQLKSPVVVRFEILKTRDKSWIIFTLLIGLLLGLLVRHLLQDNKQWEETRFKAIELMQQIIAETQKVQDKNFRQKITDVLNQLTPLMATRGGIPLLKNASDALDARVTETIRQYNDAKAEFEKELAARKTDLKALAYIFDNPALDSSLAEQLGPAIESFKTAWKDLDEQKNPTDAERAVTTGLQLTREKLILWSDYLQLSVTWLSKDGLYPANPPSGMQETVKNYLDRMQPLLAPMRPEDSDINSVVACAGKADQVFGMKGNLAKFFAEQQSMTAGNAALDQALAAWYTALKNMIENPKGLQAPGEYWSDDILKKLNAAYAAAAADAGGAGGGGVLEGAVGDEEHLEGFVAFELPFKTMAFAGPVLKPAYTPGDYFDSDGDVLPTLGAVRSFSFKKWLFYSLLQTVILSFLLAAAAYIFYAPSFVGTFAELVAIGLAAFSIDITADSVKQLSTRKG